MIGQNQDYCNKCGQKTITQCPKCSNSIRGGLHVPGFIGIGTKTPVPMFCQYCGEAYPWTEARFEAAREFANELDLEEDERKELIDTFSDLVADTPKTVVAVRKFRRLVTKAGNEAMGIFKEILVDIMNEAARKSLFP